MIAAGGPKSVPVHRRISRGPAVVSYIRKIPFGPEASCMAAPPDPLATGTTWAGVQFASWFRSEPTGAVRKLSTSSVLFHASTAVVASNPIEA